MPTVAARLAEHMPVLAREVAGEPSHRARDEWRFRTRGSLAVSVAGPRRGSWFDHEAGEGGDALGFIAHLRRVPMREAYRWALGWLGIEGEAKPLPAPQRPVAPPQPQRGGEERGTAELARRVWSEAASPAGTLVETYLRGRGLDLPADAPIWFHPECPRGAERWPAMVALMTDPETGEPCGVHRTFLARDGSGKAPGQAKMMAGRAGVIRLVPDEDVTRGLGITEGIETALAVMQRFEWAPVWAVGSAGAIGAFPVLDGIEALTVFADTDDKGAGLAAARKCAARWDAAEREARIAPAPSGRDFADIVRGAA